MKQKSSSIRQIIGRQGIARLEDIPYRCCSVHEGSAKKALVEIHDGTVRRWDELFDEGVAAVFDLASGEAELLALSFHAGKFTPARAATWLGERVLKPLLFLPIKGRPTDADFDAPVAALIGPSPSWSSA